MTKTIKAVVVANPGGVDRLEIREIPLRGVGPGDVRVSVRSIALNFRDLQQRRGVAAGSVYPLIPGSDFAGIVAEVGAQVEDFEPGDHVYGLVLDGAYAEEVVLPAAMLLRIPDGLDFATASILPVAGLSASFLLSVADLVDGASVVTFAAAGGLGCFLGGLLHRAGIRSIGLTSSADKARVAAAAGHHQVVNYHDVDPVDAVLAATGGKGVDVVFNSVACQTSGAASPCSPTRAPLSSAEEQQAHQTSPDWENNWSACDETSGFASSPSPPTSSTISMRSHDDWRTLPDR